MKCNSFSAYKMYKCAGFIVTLEQGEGFHKCRCVVSLQHFEAVKLYWITSDLVWLFWTDGIWFALIALLSTECVALIWCMYWGLTIPCTGVNFTMHVTIYHNLRTSSIFHFDAWLQWNRVHIISWTTLVVHSRDVRDCGGAPRKKSTLKPANFSYITIWQYWLGNTKTKKAFRLILNPFKKLLQNLKKNYLTEFSTDWLTH